MYFTVLEHCIFLDFLYRAEPQTGISYAFDIVTLSHATEEGKKEEPSRKRRKVIT